MHRSLCALFLLAVAPLAHAVDLRSFDYLDAGYVRSDTGGDADGWGVNASMTLDPRVHIFGSYALQNADRYPGLDLRQWSAGMGFRQPLNESVDALVRIAWNAVDVPQAREVNGLSLETGVRSALGAHMEGWALAGYSDFDAGDGEFYARLGAQARLGDHWGLATDVRLVSGDTQWFVGPRLRW